MNIKEILDEIGGYKCGKVIFPMKVNPCCHPSSGVKLSIVDENTFECTCASCESYILRITAEDVQPHENKRELQ